MSEIILNLDIDISYDVLKEKFESIAREYSLAVIEGAESGRDYPEASDNLRLLSEIIFDLSCSINDHKNITI